MDSPLLHIKAKRSESYPVLPVSRSKGRKEQELDVNWHINHCRSQIYPYHFLFDSMPVAGVMFGRDITNMGILSGYDFAIHPDTEFIRFEQNADFLFEPTPEFREEMPFVQKVLEIYRHLYSAIGQAACLNPPTTADAMTTMAMIMGMENFLFSLQRYPLAVKQKAMDMNRLFYRFYDLVYEELLGYGYGESASWFPVFAEGKFDSVRSDISVMLSEKMFMELALPVLEDACSYLDHAMFNLDSVQLIRLLKPLSTLKKLDGIYWNIEPWLNNIHEYLPILKQIKEMGMLLALPCRNVTDAKIAINNLGKNGLLLEFPLFDDPAEAIAVGEAVTKL